MQNQDTVDKVAGILREVAGVVGSTAEKLWPMAVQNTMVRGATDLIIGALLVTVFTIGYIVIFRMAKGIRDEEARIATRWGSTIIYIFTMMMTIGISVSSGLPSFLAPEGETLRILLGKSR